MLGMEGIRKIMEECGVPGSEGYELPDSNKRFPDGAYFRVKIAGVERASTLEALLDESSRRQTPVHRVIATVGGSTFCDFHELQQMARMAHEEKIAVINDRWSAQVLGSGLERTIQQ